VDALDLGQVLGVVVDGEQTDTVHGLAPAPPVDALPPPPPTCGQGDALGERLWPVLAPGHQHGADEDGQSEEGDEGAGGAQSTPGAPGDQDGDGHGPVADRDPCPGPDGAGQGSGDDAGQDHPQREEHPVLADQALLEDGDDGLLTGS